MLRGASKWNDDDDDDVSGEENEEGDTAELTPLKAEAEVRCQ